MQGASASFRGNFDAKLLPRASAAISMPNCFRELPRTSSQLPRASIMILYTAIHIISPSEFYFVGPTALEGHYGGPTACALDLQIPALLSTMSKITLGEHGC